MYNINNINVFHNNLKYFMDKFRGISTKYLKNYFAWIHIMNMCVIEVMKFIISVSHCIKCIDVFNRPSFPVLFIDDKYIDG